MTVDLAAITAVCCLGIGVCGYMIGRLHARDLARKRERGGWLKPGWNVEYAVDRWTFPPAPDVSVDPIAELTAVHMAALEDAMTEKPT